MAASIRPVEYFYTTIRDRPGDAYRLLADLAGAGINLLAINAVPLGPEATQFVLFPQDGELLIQTAGKTGICLTGPHRAFLVQGDDELGALATLQRRLFDSGVNAYASTAVTDGTGRYGCVVYVKPEDFDAASRALET